MHFAILPKVFGSKGPAETQKRIKCSLDKKIEPHCAKANLDLLRVHMAQRYCGKDVENRVDSLSYPLNCYLSAEAYRQYNSEKEVNEENLGT